MIPEIATPFEMAFEDGDRGHYTAALNDLCSDIRKIHSRTIGTGTHTFASIVSGAATVGICARCAMRCGGASGSKWYTLPYALVAAALDATLPTLDGVPSGGIAMSWSKQTMLASTGTDGAAGDSCDGSDHPGATAEGTTLIVCPCCTGLLQGFSLSCCVPASLDSGSCSVLYNTKGMGTANLHPYEAIAATAANQASTMVGEAKAGPMRRDKQQQSAAAAADRENSNSASKSGAGVDALAFVPGYRLVGSLSRHIVDHDWPSSLVRQLITGGYDLREGISLRIATTPAYLQAEEAAKSALCAKLGVYKLPFKAPELKDCVRLLAAAALERVVYDAGPAQQASASAAAVTGSSSGKPDSETVVLSVPQAERTLERLKLQQAARSSAPLAAASSVPPSSAATDSVAPGAETAGTRHVERLAGTLGDDDVDARSIVAAVTEAVALDYRLQQAQPIVLHDTVEVPVAIREIPVTPASAAHYGPRNLQYVSTTDLVAVAATAAGMKRPRNSDRTLDKELYSDDEEDVAASAAASSAATAAAKAEPAKKAKTASGVAKDAEDDDDEDARSSAVAAAHAAVSSVPTVSVAVNPSNAIVALGTVDLVSDYRILFEKQPVLGMRYVGDLAVPGVVGDGAASLAAAASTSSVAEQIVGAASAPAGPATSVACNGAAIHGSNLRKLLLWHASSLQMHVQFDAAPAGMLVPVVAAAPPAPSEPTGTADSDTAAAAAPASSAGLTPAAEATSTTLVPSPAPALPTSSFRPPITPRPAIVTSTLARGSYFFSARYCKYSRALSQTPWFVEGERKGFGGGGGGGGATASTTAPVTAAGAEAGSSSSAPANPPADGAVSAAHASASSAAASAASSAPTSVEELLGHPVAAAASRYGGQGLACGLLPAIPTIYAARAGALVGSDGGAAGSASSASLVPAPVASGLHLAKFSLEPLPAEWLPPSAALTHTPRFKFHSAGREDIDVRMLGPGRPYSIELLDTRTAMMPLSAFPRLHAEINAQGRGLVESTAPMPATREEFAALAGGAESKRKTYTALLWSSKAHSPTELKEKIDSKVSDLKVAQKTPIRVLHRRSLMTRMKTIHSAKTDWLSPHFFLLHLCTSAGTYVKEFCHGDLGRTRPNVSVLLSAGGGSADAAGASAADNDGGAAGDAVAAALARGAGRVSADILLLDVTDLIYDA